MNEPSQDVDLAAYNTRASAYCKTACVTWCLVGWLYAGSGWRLLWAPAVLIFFPGIFIAGLLAAVFFIPLWLAMKKVNHDWIAYGTKHWGVLSLATFLRIAGFLAPIAGAIAYVRLLRSFMQ